MSQEDGAVQSLQGVGENLEASNERGYNTLPQIINSEAIRRSWEEFLPKSRALENRRHVMKGITVSPLTEMEGLPVEVFIPLGPVTGGEGNLFMIAQNEVSPDKDPDIDKAREYFDQFDQANNSQPAQIIDRIRSEGNTFVSSPSYEDVDVIYDLWHDTFGWEREGIIALIDEINTRGPSERSRWFSGVRDQNGKIISASVAESMDYNGVKMIELTEWSTDEECKHKGFMAGTVVYLTAQVLQDTLYSDGQMPIIIGECNTVSRAYRSGRRAGMLPAYQVEGSGGTGFLRHNVRVDDGLEMPEESLAQLVAGGVENPQTLRNFAFMILTRDQAESLYNTQSMNSILN